MEAWLHGQEGEGSIATPLHCLGEFSEAEEHPSDLVQAFLHHTFPRAPDAVPLQPVPKIELVKVHYLQGLPRQDPSRKNHSALAKIDLGSAPAILAVGPGVWEAGRKLYDSIGYREAAALYLTQPRGNSSAPVDIVTAHGKVRWTYITHVIDAFLTFSPHGGKADGRQTHSASIWLLRPVTRQNQVAKDVHGDEIGILVLFLAGSKEEEHSRRVAELGGPQALHFDPEADKLKFLVHGLLQFVDANGIDKLGWTHWTNGEDEEGRVIIRVKGAHVFNPVEVDGERTANYSLCLGPKDQWCAVKISGMPNQPTHTVHAQYDGQVTDYSPQSRAIRSQWFIDTGAGNKFWGSKEYSITFLN